jgi:orotidine-5'-phosphate decarboxylase
MWLHNDAHKKRIRELTEKNSGITERTIQCKEETITILYIKQITNRESLANFVIKPLVEYCHSAKHALKAAEAIETVIYADDCTLEQDENAIEMHILNGMTVLLFSNDKEFAVVHLKRVDHRSVTDPEMNYNLRAPRDSFVENFDVNLSLVRYRLKDGNLRVENMEVGQRTRTRVAMLYIQDIASDTVIGEIKKHAPVIADFKVADIPNTNRLICEQTFKAGADAIICQGFTGRDSVEACVAVAKQYGGETFVVTEMSHPGALDFLQPCAMQLVDLARSVNASGIIAPATRPEQLALIRKRAGNMKILSPGVGTQGGDAAVAIKAGADFVIVGRSIYNAPDPYKAAIEFREQLRR